MKRRPWRWVGIKAAWNLTSFSVMHQYHKNHSQHEHLPFHFRFFHGGNDNFRLGRAEGPNNTTGLQIVTLIGVLLRRLLYIQLSFVLRGCFIWHNQQNVHTKLILYAVPVLWDVIVLIVFIQNLRILAASRKGLFFLIKQTPFFPLF